MQLNKNSDLKTFEIWISKSEKEKIDKGDKLKRLFEVCNEYGYKPVVYVSGSNDLILNTAEIVRRKGDNHPAA